MNEPFKSDPFRSDSFNISPTLLMLGGVSVIILGVLAIMAPLLSGITVAIVVGALLFVSGIAQTVHGWRLETMGAKALAILGGILTVVAGFIMIMNPMFGVRFLAALLAIYFAFEGIANIAFAIKFRPVRGWGWALFNGILCVVLSGLIWYQWPLVGWWTIGVLLGIHLITLGWSMIAISSELRAFRRLRTA